MPVNRALQAYRKWIVGNPWLDYARWLVRDIAESGKIRVKMEAESLREAAVACTKVIPFTARAILKQGRNKF